MNRPNSMTWRTVLRSRVVWWIAGVLAVLLLLDQGPELWRALGGIGRYQIAPLQPGWIVRLDTKTGQLEAFVLSTPEEAAQVTSMQPGLGLHQLRSP
jgi:hypothetical protein